VSPYDPLGPETLADPFAQYRDLREQCPVHWFDGFTPPFATLSRYDDVLDALKDWRRFSYRHGPSPQYTRPSGLVDDPPGHTEFRRLFNRAFTPRTISALEPQVRTIAEGLVSSFAGLGRGDLHDLYAVPLPITVIARLLGLPDEDIPMFKQMSDGLTATYNEPDPRASAGPRARFDDYFLGLVDDRRTRPADDLVSAFVSAEVSGRRLDDREICWMLLLLLLGGNETTTALLTNLLWRLLDVPSRWQRASASTAAMDAAIEESLRHDPPVLGMFRTTTGDVELHGVPLAARTKVMLCYGAANHDPAMFSEPDAFVVDRDLDESRRHLAFGFGDHYCPGSALARLEARVTLECFAERLPGLRAAWPSGDEPPRITPFLLWGRSRVPAAWG
jgi:cytochrome P450